MRNGQNGRRRGRGGPPRVPGQNRQPDMGNRMEVRVRGNAHQLLEKYKQLARDAGQAGDRVAAEYYLQHADHYFRVLSEFRSRQEDQRPRNQRDYDEDGEEFDGAEPVRVAEMTPIVENRPQVERQPRAVQAEVEEAEPVEAEAEAAEASEEKPRRRRGRPRKTPLPEMAVVDA